MCNSFCGPTVTDCTFNNNAASGGGGMNNYSSSPTVTNCTFSGNLAYSYSGGGGMCNGSSSPTVTNCILWNDTPNEISGGATLTYSDVQGGFFGIGNIDADPLFVDPNNGNFRLQTASPCIDAGDPDFVPAPGATDMDGLKRLWDGDADGHAAVDMGAYEFGSHRYGDLDCNGNLDFGDINPFVLALSNPAGYHAAFPGCDLMLADISGDGVLNFWDINPFAALLSAE